MQAMLIGGRAFFGRDLKTNFQCVGGGSKSDFDVGEEVISPYLWSRGISRLDAVAISHAHSDHVGGMRSVIANFRPRELWYGLNSPTPEFQQVAEAARAYGLAFRPYTSGDAFTFGGVKIRVLNPQS